MTRQQMDKFSEDAARDIQRDIDRDIIKSMIAAFDAEDLKKRNKIRKFMDEGKELPQWAVDYLAEKI